MTAGVVFVAALALATPRATAVPSADAVDARAETRVLVAPVVVQGDLPDSARRELAERLRGGLQRSAVTLLPPEAAAREGCDSVECLVDLAREYAATHVVRAEVIVAEKIYEVRITAHDTRSSELTLDVHETCEVCGLAEVVELVDRQAAALGDRLATWAPTPGVLSVRSDPVGAAIALDGAAKGRSPLQLSLAPGEHRVRATLDGYAPAERRVVAKQGVHETWSFTLQPLPRDDRRRMRVAGWALFGIGAASLVPGVVLLGLDGHDYQSRCGGTDRDAEGDCRYRFETTVHGAVLTAAGAALIVTGIALVAAARKR